jgi:hypothetical protein
MSTGIIREPEKPPFLGNGCVTCNNTDVIVDQRTHAIMK